MTALSVPLFDECELHAAALAAHQDYRVTRRLRERDTYGVSDGRLLCKGIVIDTETTGLASTKVILYKKRSKSVNYFAWRRRHESSPLKTITWRFFKAIVRNCW